MKIIYPLMVAAFGMGGLHLHAQTLGADYTSELQTNFADCNFVNLLRLDGQWSLGKSVTIDAATISIAKTRSERLVQDLQTFSNIEEDNLPLALAVCGLNWSIGNGQILFLGVRNMNEDYFTSDITSFFTNSSCGVYPTISANYPIANYPLSSLGMHYALEREHWGIKASIYNGQGSHRLTGSESAFRFCPQANGLFILAEASYRSGRSQFFVGNAIYCRNGTHATPWLYTEQSLNDRLSLIAGYSHAFGNDIECNDFFGIGAHYRMKIAEIGLFVDHARFSAAEEWATELTCRWMPSEHIEIQPILHFILTNGLTNSICSIRLSLKT